MRTDLYPGEGLCRKAGRKCGVNHLGRDWIGKEKQETTNWIGGRGGGRARSR